MPKTLIPKQKDIVLISLDPTIGHEQKGTRPAVIISADGFHFSGMCLMCPLTQKIKDFFGDVVLTPNKTNKLDKKSEILTGQIRAIDQNRIIKKIGEITPDFVTNSKKPKNYRKDLLFTTKGLFLWVTRDKITVCLSEKRKIQADLSVSR